MQFCKDVGLPTSLEDLDCAGLGEELLLLAAEKACEEKNSMKNMPFPVSPTELCRAILTVDRLGR